MCIAKNGIEKSEDISLQVYFTVKNPRSIKSSQIIIYRTNDTFNTLFQLDYINITNNIPCGISNFSVKSNTYYTNDRAIYTLNFLSDMDNIFEGDILEYKTSWKCNYTNEKDTIDENYYIYKYHFNRNYTSEETKNMTIIFNPMVNPETLDEQYFKDFKIYDKEGYLLAAYDGDPIPIKMDKYISFKRVEINAEGTEADYTKFNITVDIIPEVLLKANDTLRLKFSQNVLFKDVPNINIVPEKGIQTELDSENNTINNFNFEYDKENNELIFSNAFGSIAETELIFENRSANALVDQEITFTLTDIPVQKIYVDDEDSLFKVEIKTEGKSQIEDDKIITTQINNVASKAHFNCDYVCLTCQTENRMNCLTCKKEYPYYIKSRFRCLSVCPSSYYAIENEDGKECKECQAPCETCYGNENNCTSCVEGYYLEDGICVEKCSEDYVKDEEFRVCYPIDYINDTRFNDTFIYQNVSKPEP